MAFTKLPKAKRKAGVTPPFWPEVCPNCLQPWTANCNNAACEPADNDYSHGECEHGL